MGKKLKVTNSEQIATKSMLQVYLKKQFLQ